MVKLGVQLVFTYKGRTRRVLLKPDDHGLTDNQIGEKYFGKTESGGFGCFWVGFLAISILTAYHVGFERGKIKVAVPAEAPDQR